MPSTKIQRATIADADTTLWRQQIEKDLKGAAFERRLVHLTDEGIPIQPLYQRDDLPKNVDPSGFPGHSSRTRGEQSVATSGTWEVLACVNGSSLNETAAQAERELSNGATGLLFDSTGTGDPATFWTTLFRQVDPRSTVISLPSTGEQTSTIAALTVAARETGASEEDLSVYGGLDPLGALASQGSLDEQTWQRIAYFARDSWAKSPNSRLLRIDDGPYHCAGASESQALGSSVAAAIDTMRALEQHGMSCAESAAQLEFFIHLDCEFFAAIAKIRALRRLWSTVRAQCGFSAPLRIHTRTSPRVLSARDPWVNILRNTSTCFAAAVGGVQAITTDPFDSRLGLSSEGAQRLARNTQLVLAMESHLGQVIDPSGGSYFIESLTDRLAESAWAFTQEIESRGGMTECLKSGWIHESIALVRDERIAKIRKRKKPLTGVSEFPNLGETAPIRQPVPKVPEEFSNEHPGSIEAPALPKTFFAEPFETLRNRSDSFLEEHGRRPNVHLLLLGEVADHTARATFVRNLVEAGGLEATMSPPLHTPTQAVAHIRTLSKSNAPMIFCGSNADLTAQVREIASQVQANEPHALWMAGEPESDMSAYFAAGIQQTVRLGHDMVAKLEQLWALVEAS